MSDLLSLWTSVWSSVESGHQNLSPKLVESREMSGHVVGVELNGKELETHDRGRLKQAGGPWHAEAQEKCVLSEDLKEQIQGMGNRKLLITYAVA